MAKSGTDKTFTVDACVVHYYFLFKNGYFKNGYSLQQGLPVRRIRDFCNSVMDKYPIAINKFIRTEYEQLEGYGPIKIWLSKRLQNDMAIEVKRLPLPKNIKSSLGNDYGFDCQSMDATYLRTCLNTIFKHLITENTEHFMRPHHTRRGRPMHAFVQSRLCISIYTIDECCSCLLDD
jgi:hypothetical protein